MALDIAVLLLPRFSLMALASVLETFRIANRLAGGELYRWRFVSREATRSRPAAACRFAYSDKDCSRPSW